MDFIVKKTHELTEKDLEQIQVLYEKAFHESRSKEIFLNQYIQNPLGYSWHSLLIENNEIHGLNTFIPAYFNIRGQKMLFANSVDSIIDKPYRDFFNFSDMLKAGFKTIKEDGVVAVYGYPNDNSYPVLIKGKIYKDLGKMRIYCLPYRIGGIKPLLKFLNPLSKLVSRGYVLFSKLFASSKTVVFPIEKDTISYNETRYKRSNGAYGIISDINLWFSYKIQCQQGIKTAFIIDVIPKSPKNFVKAVGWLIKNESRNFDLIIYPGYLPFKISGMLKLPRKLEPKNFNFTVKILDKKTVDDSILKIENWDTNLSTYDLL